MNLPIEFLEKMKKMLSSQYEDFLASYEQDVAHGLRINPLKGNAREIAGKITPLFHLQKIPWAAEGYYYENDKKPGRHPYHEAGVYYIQEPSAMAVVEVLKPVPGDRVLDLCAAPGGKTSHIAGKLNGEGFLLSNEIHPQRAKILSQNVERMGITNAVVVSAEPAKLAKHFPEYFDKIVVDAPCSGEGMFHKDQIAIEHWSQTQVEICADRQLDILQSAAAMLKPGGRIVYSTCTFAPEENEGTIECFLRLSDEFELETIDGYAGFEPGNPHWIEAGRSELSKTRRLWPHKINGEGHFIAVLKRKPAAEIKVKKYKYPETLRDKLLLKDFEQFYRKEISNKQLLESGRLILFGEQLYLLPLEMLEMKGIKVMRPGLHLGTLKKNRFEPAHALALALKPSDIRNSYQLTAEQKETRSYLKGEVLYDEGLTNQSGWNLVLVDGYSLGWGKAVGAQLKNHYPKGLRIP